MALSRIRYLQGYGSVFDGPHRWNNLLLLSVCNLIPILGHIVVSGYCYEIIELNSKAPGTPNPKFTFERFTYYLTRGAWPYVLQLLCQFLLQPPLMILMYGIMIPLLMLADSLGEKGGVAVLCLTLALMLLLGLTVAAGLTLLLTPLFLRAGLAQDFVKAFDLAWIIDFDRRVGLDAVLAMLFMACTGIMIFYTGYAMCLVGVIPAITIITICSANLSSQLYNLYLARGGMPVPTKPPPAPPQPILPPPEPNQILLPTIPGEIA